jgi:hypothetical protein
MVERQVHRLSRLPMVPLLHLGGGHGQDSPCTSSIRLTGAVCVTQLLKSDLPLSEGYGPSIERARPNPAVRGIGSAQDSVGLLTRNGDIRRNGDLTRGESDFDCMVRRMLGVHWRSDRFCMNGMRYEVRWQEA